MRTNLHSVDPIDMDRDRGLGAGIAEPMNLFKPAPGETAVTSTPGLGAQGRRLRGSSIEAKQRFGESAAVHPIGTPSIVGVNGTELASGPDQREDGEAALRVGMEDVTSVAIGAGEALIRRQQDRIGGGGLKSGNHALGHPLRRAVASGGDFGGELSDSAGWRGTAQ
jgi:hypothetical protein